MQCAAICCTLLLCTLFASCKKEDTSKQEDTSGYYKWSIEESRLPVENFLYEGGYYYVVLWDHEEGEQYLMKVDEKDGHIAYKNLIVKNYERPSSISSGLYFYDDKLIYLYNKSIYHIDKQLGTVMYEDAFPNFIYTHKMEDDYFTAVSYADNFTKFRFYEFVYDGQHFYQRDIHAEYFTHAGGAIDFGTSPIKIPGGWIMTYGFTDTDRKNGQYFIIYIKDGQLVKNKVPLKQSIGDLAYYNGDEFIIFPTNGTFVKVRKDDPSKYVIEDGLPFVSINPIQEYGDNLYFTHANYVHNGNIICKYDPRDGSYETFPADAFLGTPIIMNDMLCYINHAKFARFSLKYHVHAQEDPYEWASYSSFPHFGVSPNSKLLFSNSDGTYYCYPFDWWGIVKKVNKWLQILE